MSTFPKGERWGGGEEFLVKGKCGAVLPSLSDARGSDTGNGSTACGSHAPANKLNK